MSGRAPTADEARLLAAIDACLDGIVDPCSVAANAPAGLYDMGMVGERQIHATDAGYRAIVILRVTHPFCMVAGVFLNEVKQRVGAIDGICEVEATLDSETIWTPELMSDRYRSRLDAAKKNPERGRSR